MDASVKQEGGAVRKREGRKRDRPGIGAPSFIGTRPAFPQRCLPSPERALCALARHIAGYKRRQTDVGDDTGSSLPRDRGRIFVPKKRTNLRPSGVSRVWRSGVHGGHGAVSWRVLDREDARQL